jgi:hypothetical protein
MTSNRISTYTNTGTFVELYVSDCAACGVVFAMTVELENRRRKDRDSFYCPNGHGMHFTGKTDEQKLREAEAREVALQDQLRASIAEGEATRAVLLRDRSRIANGVCPCCNRSFENVRRHISTKHPDYDVTRVRPAPKKFKCGCGASFDTYRGLRVHQGWARRGRDWTAPGLSSWQSHLTEVTS